MVWPSWSVWASRLSAESYTPPTEVVGNADYIEQLRKRFGNLGNGRLCDRLPTDDCTGQPKMHAPGPTNDSENLRNLFSGGLRLNMDLKS